MSFCFIKGLISVRHHFGSIYFIWTALLITLLQSYHIHSTQYISWQTKKKHSTKSYLSQTHRLLYHRHSSYCFIPTYFYFLYKCTFPIVLWKHILYSLKRHIPYTVLSTHISYCLYAVFYRHIPYYFIQTYSLSYTATCHTISWCFIQWYSIRYTPPDWVCRVSSCLAWSNICILYNSQSLTT